jgi:hypothetical protein
MHQCFALKQYFLLYKQETASGVFTAPAIP